MENVGFYITGDVSYTDSQVKELKPCGLYVFQKERRVEKHKGVSTLFTGRYLIPLFQTFISSSPSYTPDGPHL